MSSPHIDNIMIVVYNKSLSSFKYTAHRAVIISKFHKREGETEMMWILLALAVVVIIAITILIIMLRIVVVQEATAVAFKFLGRFRYCAMEFENHHFDTNGNICDGVGPKGYGHRRLIWRFGGWVFYIHPFVEPACYKEQNGEDSFGHDVYVHLNDITPEPVATTAETADPENVALTVKFVSTMRVINPYRWLFPSPKDVNIQVVKRQDSFLRAWVRIGDQKHTQAARGNGESLWQELIANGPGQLNCGPIIAAIEKDWGLRILPNKIVVEDVGYDLEYQEALKAASQAKLIAKGEAARITAIDTALDAWIASHKKSSEDLEQTRERLMSDGDQSKGVPSSYEKQRSYYATQLLGGDLIRISGGDGTPLTGELGPAIALFSAAFGNRGGQKGKKGQQQGGDQEKKIRVDEKGNIV